jgi:hypothetical protein
VTSGIAGGETNAARRATGWGVARGRDSEQEGLFAAIRWQAQTHMRGTVGAFDGQLQDQQSLAQAVIVELGCAAERFGDETVGDFEFFEDG